MNTPVFEEIELVRYRLGERYWYDIQRRRRSLNADIWTIRVVYRSTSKARAVARFKEYAKGLGI